MAKALRLMNIKKLLTERGAADMQTLCELNGVSKPTTRSDLMELEEEGFLIRTHGGAVLKQPVSPLPTVSLQTSSIDHSPKMMELRKIVERHVIPSSWVLLGYGNTCREIAKNLLHSNIKVVTGNIDAAVILSESKSIEIFIPGGYLCKHYDYLMLNGEWYQKALLDLTVDQAYISVAGVDASGFSVGDVLECRTLDLIRKIAREVIVVVDSNKFDYTAFFRLSDFSYADTIITNDDIPDNYRELIAKAQVKLLTPSDFS